MISVDDEAEFEEKILKAMMEPIDNVEDGNEYEKDKEEGPEEPSPHLSGSAMPTPGKVPSGTITSTPSGTLYKWGTPTGISSFPPSPTVPRGGVKTPMMGHTDESPSKKKKRMVNLPPRFTEKVLIAFIDEENPDDESNVIWAANLEPDFIEMVHDGEDTYLQIKLSMEDVYGNRLAED